MKSDKNFNLWGEWKYFRKKVSISESVDKGKRKLFDLKVILGVV